MTTNPPAHDALLWFGLVWFAGYHADCTEQIKVRVSEIEASAHAHAHAQAHAGMAWHGMAWHGMAWHGMASHGIAWHGMAWQRERILRASGALAWAEKRVQCSQCVPC